VWENKKRVQVLSSLIQGVNKQTAGFTGIRKTTGGGEPFSPRQPRNGNVTRNPVQRDGYFTPRAGAVDARSLGAGNGQQGIQPEKLLRGLSLRNERRNKHGDLGRNLARASAGLSTGNRDRPKGRRLKTPRRSKRDKFVEEGGKLEDLDEPTQQYLLEKQEMERPKAVRYNPEPYTLDRLKATWPSLPLGVAGVLRSVMEKFSWMGERFVGSFETPQDLAEKIREGKRVYFKSEEEKNETLQVIKQQAEERAELIAQKKGGKVEPKDTSFEALDAQERMALIGSVVAGKYGATVAAGSNPHENRLHAEIKRTLGNNSTYTNPQSAKFFETLEKLVPTEGQTPKTRKRATQ
jgi:hypothetical protein